MTVADQVRCLTDATDLLVPYVPATTAEEARMVVRQAEQRVGLGVDLTVVAVAGSTGSGKSSVFNAIAGLDLAAVGLRRPTTDEPTACVWGDHDAGPLLDWLAVPPRRRTAWASALDDREQPLDGLVLLDLPDHDSVVASHRAWVDRLVERVDMVVWVTDPIKYADALLHDRYLRRLTHHGAVLVVALNQVDRLAADEQTTVLDDLRRLVSADGLDGVPVLAMSAEQGAGVAALRARLERAVHAREAALRRVAADVARSADGLARACHAAPPEHPSHAATPGGPAEQALVEDLADVLDGAWSGDARAPDPTRALGLVDRYVDQATAGLPDSWRGAVRDEVRCAGDDLVRVCDTAATRTRRGWAWRLRSLTARGRDRNRQAARAELEALVRREVAARVVAPVQDHLARHGTAVQALRRAAG